MIERLARLGYAAIGIVYVIVGGFAIAAATGQRGSAGGQKDAFAFILHQPFGRALLAVIALGLTGYTLWRFVSALTDSEHRGSDAKGLAIRVGGAARGAIYGVIAIGVIRMVLRGSSSGGAGGGERQTRHWTARALDAPFGRWLVAAAGIAFVVAGAWQLYAAWDAKLSKRLSLGQISDSVRRKVVAISRFGIGARGVVFFVIGGSLVVAALRQNPAKAHGTSGALQILPPWLLLFVGFGLAAFGVYALVNARYRRISAT